jgi:hypothetical protein
MNRASGSIVFSKLCDPVPDTSPMDGINSIYDKG